jgi:hypothetical protein
MVAYLRKAGCMRSDELPKSKTINKKRRREGRSTKGIVEERPTNSTISTPSSLNAKPSNTATPAPSSTKPMRAPNMSAKTISGKSSPDDFIPSVLTKSRLTKSKSKSAAASFTSTIAVTDDNAFQVKFDSNHDQRSSKMAKRAMLTAKVQVAQVPKKKRIVSDSSSDDDNDTEAVEKTTKGKKQSNTIESQSSDSGSGSHDTSESGEDSDAEFTPTSLSQHHGDVNEHAIVSDVRRSSRPRAFKSSANWGKRASISTTTIPSSSSSSRWLRPILMPRLSRNTIPTTGPFDVNEVMNIKCLRWLHPLEWPVPSMGYLASGLTHVNRAIMKRGKEVQL